MKFLSFSELKKIEKENPKEKGKALLKAFILAATVASVLIVLQSSLHDNSIFTGLLFGIVTFFVAYSTSMYEFSLLKQLGFSEKNADEEINGKTNDE